MNTEKRTTKKTMVKKLTIIALALMMLLSFVGCGKKKETQGGGQQNAESSMNDSSANDSSDNNSSDSKPNESEDISTSYTVTFKDYDGTVLKTQKVEGGKGATAPKAPKREHFKFAGWDKSFDKVTANLVVTAIYTTTKTVISAESVTVNKGAKEVSMNIRIYNNPGIMGAVLKVTVNDKVFAFSEAKKSQFPGLTLTSSGSGTKSSPYTFMLDALELSSDDKKDGTLFTITFKVKDTDAVGKFDVALSYDKGAIFDEKYNDPKVVLENGTINIK